MKMSYLAVASLLCLSFSSSAAFAQQQGGAYPTGQLQTPNTADRRLVLDVVVTDKSGKPVKGLEQKDFTVLDNGHPRTVLSFQTSGGDQGPAAANAQPETPVQFILLVDEVNTNFGRVAYERDQIKRFLLQNGGKLAHPTSMAFFSDSGTEIQNATSLDGTALLATFDQHETGLRSIRRSEGVYGALERFQLSLNTLNSLLAREAEVPGRKMVIWISPGWPILSGPGVELSDKERAGLLASIVSISTALRQKRITLYNVNPQGADDAGGIQAFYYREFLKPITAAKQVLLGNLALQVLAIHSGGLVFTASNDITGQIDRCVADADVFYTLTLDAATAEKPNEYHAIEVKIAAPGLTARTQSGYYVQP
ncbi:MAG TPA: VWA domain-containing protein [Edaphobacter sp.]|jgi:VWFA-related protein|nr:VWA domain-containing protein [Edaphobacter sp.]